MKPKLKRRIMKIVTITTAWMLLIQSIVPPVVMAEELVATNAAESSQEQTTGQENTSPSPSPEPSSNTQTTESISESTAEITSSPIPSPSTLPEGQNMETGMAVANGTGITDVNTTAEGSTIEVGVTTITDPTTQEVTPFNIPESTPEPSSSSQEETATPSAEMTVTNLQVSNQATVSAEVIANADTGNNNQENHERGGNSNMGTGTAIALANNVAIVNTTLINSTLQVGVVNVLTAYSGDIILDPLVVNGEQPTLIPAGVLSLSIDNNGQVVVSANATATTGDNSQTTRGDATMTTGDALATSQTAAVVGATIVDAQILQILVDNLWLWTGLIYNLTGPGSVHTPAEVIGLITGTNVGNCTGGCENLKTTVNNSADVTVSAEAIANTGGNTQVSSGSAQMTTGTAIAGATATAIVNTTLINSRLSILHLLLFAPWTGNLIFAYPDLVTSVSAPAAVTEGEEITYTIAVKNVGHKTAQGVHYGYGLTNDSHDVGSGDEALADILPGQVITRTVTFPTAGRGGHTVTITAMAASANTESSSSNNLATAATLVQARSGEGGEGMGENQGTPALSLTASNNAGNGVYPGDQVTYDMDAYNNGPIGARNVILKHAFYAPDGTLLSSIEGKVGELGVTKSKSISFKMAPNPELKSGVYYTMSQLEGDSDSGKTKSNMVRNNIRILAREVTQTGLVQSASAQEPESEDLGGAVLGTTPPNTCEDCASFPWYLAVIAGTAVAFGMVMKQKDWRRLTRLGLALPLAAYAGLLSTSGECRQGLLIQGNLWCQWFLPISYLIYAGEVTLIGRVKKLLKRKMSRQ